MIGEFLKSFIILVAILDPFVNLPAFVTLTKNIYELERRRIARDSVLTAGIVLLFFLFFGEALLSFLGITLSSFQIAGGLILLLIGIQLVLDIELTKEKERMKESSISMLIGTPLLAGPGAITTLIILSGTYGFLTTLLALISSLLVVWFVFSQARTVMRIFGQRWVEIASRVMGLILAAFAVELIKTGIFTLSL